MKPVAVTVFVANLLASAPALGQDRRSSDTLSLAQAVTQARTANPMLRATRLRADAAWERVPQAGALPDPELSFGLMNRMVGSLRSTMDPMTMNQLQVNQMLPWPGKLAFAKNRAERLAQADQLDAEDAELMVVARVKSVYYELAYIDRALAIMAGSRDLLRDFAQVSQTMYAVGSGLQQDVLQAQVAVARMTEEITVMQQERVAMAARLNALMGRDATTSVGELELSPLGAELPEVDTLMALAVARRPRLQAARERVQAAEAAYRLARRELYPDLMLGASYGQRPAFDDMASLMVGIRIPLWARSRQLPMRKELQAMHAMADAEARDVYNETYAELAELRAGAMRSLNLARLYATAIEPQARASVEAALAAYRVGRVDYMSLVENQMTVNRYATESVRLVAAYHQAMAEVEAVVGAEPGGVR
ncbi:MAG: TolC family protein [Gemmatimonadetes bacterium]|nr:TolC family protein [Gemmatimonadota bacterium]